MPPANSPTRAQGDPDFSDSLPHLTNSTRLPVIRVGPEGAPELSGRRLEQTRSQDQLSFSTNHQEFEHRLRNDSTADFEAWILSEREPLLRMQGYTHADRTLEPPYAMSTYRGWAPGTTDSEPTASATLARNENRSTATRRYRREQELSYNSRPRNSFAALLSEHGIAEDIETDLTPWRMNSARPSTTTHSDSGSLRAAAILESARRQTRSEILRERLQNSDAHRAVQRIAQRGSNDIIGGPVRPPVPELSRARRHRDSPDLTEHYNAILAEQQHKSQAEKQTVGLFEEVIEILDGARDSFSEAATMSAMKAGRFINSEKDYIRSDKGFAIRDLAPIAQPTSWLHPGATFSGKQKSAPSRTTVRSRHGNGHAFRRAQNSNAAPASSSSSSPNQATSEMLNRVSSAAAPAPDVDFWPVTVTITGIDYERMALTGKMEAFNVPNTKTALGDGGAKVSSITTYLEGEIIDLNTHSLQTTNFTAGRDTDAKYWRRLEPFKSLNVNEIIGGITDSQWLREALSTDWILMRWKEKCFISPSDSSSGLTISGFYYITMRRSDGRIEGLYHDPDSCPYQHLVLSPDKPAFPAYTFR